MVCADVLCCVWLVLGLAWQTGADMPVAARSVSGLPLLVVVMAHKSGVAIDVARVMVGLV